MKKYLSIILVKIMDKNIYRVNIISTFLGNILYLAIIYSLWNSIFSGSSQEVINGMDFQNTFIYLAITNTMSSLFQSFTVWYMSYSIMQGRIIHDLLKPMTYQAYIFFYMLGDVISNVIYVFIPSFIVVSLITGMGQMLVNRFLWFFVSITLAMCINFFIDFFVGSICFYTESTWGINIVKNVVVLLLSGAIIPIPFFPGIIRKVVECLPFHAIYNMPVQILINDTYSYFDYARVFLVQGLWVVGLFILSRIFFNHASKVVVVNGG